MSYREVSEIRDGMRVDWDMPIEMDDGIVLRCDIYRPIKPGRYPVIMTYGPYGKWLHFDDLYGEQWKRMCEIRPDVPTGSTNKYQAWEVVDPEKWVPDGYALVWNSNSVSTAYHAGNMKFDYTAFERQRAELEALARPLGQHRPGEVERRQPGLQ